MKTIGLRQRLRKGAPLIGTMVKVLRIPEAPPIFADLGYGFVILDTEHFPYNPETAAAMVLAGRSTSAYTVVRTQGMDLHQMVLMLDAGCDGILVPHVDTGHQAEEIVHQAKYHPMGARSVNPRAAHTSFSNVPSDRLVKEANARTAVIAQIESKAGIDHLDDILSVDGIDCAFLGQFDLSQSLGILGQLDHSQMQEATEAFVAGCHRHGVTLGVQVYDTAHARQWLERGARFISISNDLAFLSHGATHELETLGPFKT